MLSMISTLRPDQQDSQKGLQAAVRVCHPRGYLLEDHASLDEHVVGDVTVAACKSCKDSCPQRRWIPAQRFESALGSLPELDPL